MRRCNTCVLPESTPNIVFDENGTCDHCRTHHRIQYKGEAELLRLLRSHRRADSKYDCVVTVSGGRDSCFTLLKLVKDYGMRVLAVNYQNPFTDPQAKANIANAVKALNVDIVRFKLKRRIHERILRNDVIAWFRKPSPSMVNVMCIPCRVIAWRILRIAKEHKVGCIVGGANPFEKTSFKKELQNVSRDESYYMYITKAACNVLKQTLGNPGYFNPVCIPTMLKGYAFAVVNAINPKLFGLDIPMIELFHYIPWNEEEVVSRLMSEVGWNYPERLGSSWRFDCKVGHLKDFMYMKTLRMTEKDDFYAKAVREGLMTREAALQRLEKENKLHLDEVRSLLEQVGINDTAISNKLNGCPAA